MIRNVVIILLLGAGLWACSDVYKLSAESKSVVVDDAITSNASIDSMIAPYQDSMSAIMDEVIAFAPADFTKGRPNAALNNWAADAVLDLHARRNPVRGQPQMIVISLLNVGGLRNPINQGDVTVGDIFKVMPFDNEVVWVEMPWETIPEITNYLIQKGGEPIAGARLDRDTLLIDGVTAPAESFWIITSDYLMNGGDKMDFFEQRIDQEYHGGLLRDVFMEAAKTQDTLVFDNGNRIQL
ncbi:MAG: 5'-nucleotidase C-terminal domain-containing protein [bacterium]|nr:5'-nucleotidase C-terminal domain-containing protein [bacterium]